MNLGEKRHSKWWSEPDTFTMLTLIEQMDLVRELDKKRQRNDSHFRRLRQCLAKRDIHFTVNQIRNRWKSLKHKYRKIKLATYRSPAARLSAMESFRYFRRLDRMLARRSRSGGPDDQEEEGGCSRGLGLVERSDLEEIHQNSEDASCPATPWPSGTLLESETESIAPKLDSSADEGTNAEDLASPGAPSWPAGPGMVMTLGLSGEYLYAVKSEPQSHLNPNSSIDESGSSQAEFPATSEDTCRLILQQLTILNHQLGEQLAEQRAFHCSMLGMMDRQIEVLEQLSNFTRNHHHHHQQQQQQPKVEEEQDEPSSLTQKVQEALLRILRGADSQTVQPCLSRPPPSESTPPPWTVSLVEVHKRSPASSVATAVVDGETSGEAEAAKTTDVCKAKASSLPSADLLSSSSSPSSPSSSSSPRNGTLQNGLC